MSGQGIRVESCEACGWRPFKDLRPWEVAGTVPQRDECPECGEALTVTHLDMEIVPAAHPPTHQSQTNEGGER